MVKSHAVLQELGKVASEQILVFWRDAQRAIHRKRSGNLSRHLFCIAAPGSKQQERRQPCQNSGSSYSGPETMDRIGNTRKILHRKLVQGNRAFLDLNQLHSPPKPSQPLRDIRRISHTAAQEQKPGRGWGKCHGHLVIQATLRIS